MVNANADFSASTSGNATGVTVVTTLGTVGKVKAVVDWRGKNWQEVICTPTALDGNGNAQISINVALSGISAGDVVGGEIDVYIDDGAGGAPAVYQYSVRTIINTAYSDVPKVYELLTSKGNVGAVVDHHIASTPVVAPATVGSPSLNVLVMCSQITTPFRVRVARPRAVKLGSTY